jgi:radical SAM enzyme (TIGR01210 family)
VSGAVNVYPRGRIARDRFVLERRGPRVSRDPWQHQGVLIEDERAADGRITRAATVFLTGRECPWRCVMCDLWQYTTAADTPSGAIPAQILSARREFTGAPVQCLKLYNAGSFFDPRAVPDTDYAAIAAALHGVPRVVVESHPSLIGARTESFLAAVRASPDGAGPAIEIAMGLETAHPAALEALHKGITVTAFARAASRLRALGAALRVFVLIAPPFVPGDEQDRWLLESIDVALSCGASVVSMIPARSGNGAMEALASAGHFRAPRLNDVERGVRLAHATHGGRGRIFADLWDLERFSACAACLDLRHARLHEINLSQRVAPEISCSVCGGS